MSRGNSIIASVVLIGILGTLSIALQATTPSTRTVAVLPESQSANVGQVATASQAKNPTALGCLEGFKYEVRKVNGKTQVSCTLKSGTQCRGNVETGEGLLSDTAYKSVGGEACMKIVQTSNTKAQNLCQPVGSALCDLWHCFKKQDGKEHCVKVKGDFKVGEGFAPANNEAFAMRELVREAANGGPEAIEALKALKADAGTSGGIDHAFRDVIEEQKGRVEAGKKALIDCVDSCPQPAGLAAEKWLKDEQEKLQKMLALNKDLGNVGTIGPPKDPTGPASPRGQSGDTGNNQGQGGQRQPTTGFGQQSGSGSPQKPASSGSGTSNPYQQCYPQYFCTNNTLYWGSPQGQQQASYYPYYGSGCQNQTVQYCQYGCAQGGSACSQNPQNTGQMPVATLSCGGNSVRDVGASVPITFSCTNATASAGSGFSTGGALSGSASTTIQKPPAGANTVSYGLTCTASNNQTASARCDVGINVTSIVIVANPKQVTRNASTTIGWVTKGMKECVIQADNASDNAALGSFNTDNAGNTAVSGVATTPGLIADTTFTLTCKTQAGQNKNAAVTVKVQ